MPKQHHQETETDLTQNEHSNRTLKQVGGMLLASISLSSALFNIGCSAKTVEPTPRQTTTTEATKSPEKAPTLSASEQAYAEYIKTLTPEQAKLRDSLNPDALAVMSDEQLAQAFTIKASEVATDTEVRVDPALYAEAFTARMQAASNSGISEKEYKKWGGSNQVGTDDIVEISKRYFDIESKALFGYVGTEEIVQVTLTKGVIVDGALNSTPPRPKEPYHFRIMVKPDTVKSTVNEQGTLDVEFMVHMSDNWDEDIMGQNGAKGVESTDADQTWRIYGLGVTPDEVMTPGKVDL